MCGVGMKKRSMLLLAISRLEMTEGVVGPLRSACGEALRRDDLGVAGYPSRKRGRLPQARCARVCIGSLGAPSRCAPWMAARGGGGRVRGRDQRPSQQRCPLKRSATTTSNLQTTYKASTSHAGILVPRAQLFHTSTLLSQRPTPTTLSTTTPATWLAVTTSNLSFSGEMDASFLSGLPLWQAASLPLIPNPCVLILLQSSHVCLSPLIPAPIPRCCLAQPTP
ncbi:hypothetical protein EXIGLDRAFT_33847 [Exidia glandulosa HHB12029]|uniref:Uncharacterized protein n=1 Tax=Exidia glandulosa HHB12029 TaxID=1314781 RepID=A0A165ITQ7_EXIGL|nr:hypothetical protein EXIGLDRAFT_33847 [Exidia glandulosa HHB12029]